MPSKPKIPTPEQSQVINEVLKNLYTMESLSGSLIGPAGSGKTFTLQELAKEILKLHCRDTVFFLTPTHKANRVLRGKLPKPLRSNVSTIHRFIGVRPKKNRDSKDFVAPSPHILAQAALRLDSRLRLVVIDESSMVSQSFADHIEEVCQLAKQDIFVLFCGDPYQLPPVEKGEDIEEDEVVYSKNMCKQFVASEFKLELFQVKRHDGVILEGATKIRENFKGRHSLASFAGKDEHSEVKVFSKEGDWKDSLVKQIKNGIEAQALCFTNASCRHLTDFVRYSLYGPESRYQWMPGEKIFFPKYTELPTSVNIVTREGSAMPIYSSTKATIKSVSIYKDMPLKVGPYHYQTPKTRQDRIFHEEIFGDFQEVVAETERGHRVCFFYPVFQELSYLRDWHRMVRRKVSQLESRKIITEECILWDDLAAVKVCFPTVYSEHVMTVHNSQGSTFKNAYLYSDIEQCSSDFRNSLLYVALTRASDAVFPLIPTVKP